MTSEADKKSERSVLDQRWKDHVRANFIPLADHQALERQIQKGNAVYNSLLGKVNDPARFAFVPRGQFESVRNENLLLRARVEHLETKRTPVVATSSPDHAKIVHELRRENERLRQAQVGTS